jgi:deferrochelatase/peroxidase EfeB
MSEGERRRLTRRNLLFMGASGAGLVVAGGAGIERLTAGGGQPPTYPFYGERQAGIVTPAQDRLHFAAFDLRTDDPAEVRDLLRAWTEASARMCAGRVAGEANADPGTPPEDTGEALGLTPARLTVTFGFGPAFFDQLGLEARRPAQLAELPVFPNDALVPDRSGGDLCVQACADDPQVVFHAVRNLARIGRGLVVMRWAQLGFGRTSSTSRAQETPRNLMGFKDGTNNLKLEDEDLLAEHVWVGDRDEPEWMRGGTYLVARRIRMLIEVWDRATLADQEATIGRVKESGAPLGARHEFDPVRLDLEGEDGEPVVPVDAHVRRASAEETGIHILRRGYSFTDGMDERLGQLDAGLFFLAFQRDPRRQFVPLQQRLGENDALNEYVKHTGSAVFACPPGVRPGGYVGDTLL